MKKMILFSAVSILIVLSSSCSELIPKQGLFPVSKNSIIVLDQKNQSVLSYNTMNQQINLLGTLPTTTPNDIKIKGDFAYVLLSSPFSNPSDGNKLVRYNLITGDTAVLSFALDSNPYAQVIDGDRIYVTLSKSNQVAVVDTLSFSLETVIDLSPVGAPYGIAADSNNVYVSTSVGYVGWGDPGNYTNSRITVISKSNMVQVTNMSCVKNPVSLTIFGQKLYIAGSSAYDTTGKVQELDLVSLALTDISEIPLCAPAYIKSCDGKLFVIDGTYGGTGGLYIYDIAGKTVDYVLSNVSLQGMELDGSMLYLTESFAGTKTYKVNLNSLAIETISGIGGGDCAIYR